MWEGTARFLISKMYEPGEDSYMLQEHVEKYAKGAVLDMGTGTGIQAITASRHAKKVIAADIDKEAVKQARISAEIEKIKNIEFIESDLFENIPKQKFDLIVFNPPYLPEDKKVKDIALTSPKRGTKTTTRFLDEAGNYLKQDGVILLIFSSLASQSLIDQSIKKNLLEKKMLEKRHIFFEDIILLELKKKPMLKQLESLDISDGKLHARGKRGVVIKAVYKKKEVAVKTKKKESDAPGTIRNEVRFLKILNKENIGPKLIMHKENIIVMEFIKGEFIEDFAVKENKKTIISVLKKTFLQLHHMDMLGINKFEMHHPVKHIIVKKNNEPVLIDFERCRRTEDPKNVTQFCDFLISIDGSRHIKGL